jgi:aspartyl-tRNA(Asn)/glutamyl-tRNA(Gln) amidotransferase subunit B
LPVLNRAAAELGFQAALALDCRIAPESVFARKNYFYPDLPKAYQISQYELPFASGGGLDIRVGKLPVKRVRIHRIHLEEDAGKLLHAIGARELDHSLVDFNRGGTPLVEIVSEPDIRSADEAVAYLTALKEILQYAGISRCDMEKGELRCDANVSVRPEGESRLGTRTEIKNLNSFRFLKAALEFEFQRQTGMLEAGERVIQETRLWDQARGSTAAMRSKEEAQDYRYFPDPDLPALVAAPAWIEELRGRLPELPAVRRSRFMAQYGLSVYDAEVLTATRALGDYFDAAVRGPGPGAAKTAANLVATELLARLNSAGLGADQSRIPPGELGALAEMIVAGALSSKGAKAAFSALWDKGGSARATVEALGLSQISDEGRLRAWLGEALAADPQAAADLKSGKERAVGVLMGAAMKLSQGRADPAVLNRLIKEFIRA